MRQLLLISFLFIFSFASKDEDKIVRPIKFSQIPRDAKLLKDMEEDEVIPEHQGQLDYIEENMEEDSNSSEEEEEKDYDPMEKIGSMKKSEDNMKKAFQLLTVILSDYTDYNDDYDSVPKQDFPRRNPAEEQMKKIESISPAEFIAEQKPKPMLAIDPPRKPYTPNFSKDEESINQNIPIPVIIKETATETDSILIPWNISVSIDISHLLLLVLAGLFLFWIIQKAFAHYARPRQVVISPVSAEDGSVRKVPLE